MSELICRLLPAPQATRDLTSLPFRARGESGEGLPLACPSQRAAILRHALAAKTERASRSPRFAPQAGGLWFRLCSLSLVLSVCAQRAQCVGFIIAFRRDSSAAQARG